MVECIKCRKKLRFFSKKYYVYPGKMKGSFEITDEKVVCKECISKIFPESKNGEKSADFTLLLTKGEYNEALKLLNSIFNNYDPGHWYNKGLVLKELHRFEEAIRCFDEALFRDTHYTKAWYWKGRVLIDLKKHLDAVKAFENVIKLDPENKQERMLGAILLTAAAYLNLKKTEEATEWFYKLYLLIGDNPQFRNTEFDEFLKYCLDNFDDLLEVLVQAPTVEIRKRGYKH